ncbi:MAG: hypothetical protein N3G22_00915 [Candidatus Micrarchaeota archaeon]|nr:hypothetical protein [Candidatus Micrarchaeota archaeon]
MELLLRDSKSSASPVAGKEGRREKFFRRVESYSFLGCLRTVRNLATKEWVVDENNVAIRRRMPLLEKEKTKEEIEEKIRYLEYSAKTLRLVQEIAMSIKNGRVEQKIEEIRGNAEKRLLARNAERYAKIAFGTFLELPPSKEGEYLLKDSAAFWTMAIAGAFFAAFPSPITAIGLGAASAFLAHSLYSTYRWSRWNIEVATGKKKTGYLFIDRMARLSEANLERLASFCEGLIRDINSAIRNSKMEIFAMQKEKCTAENAKKSDGKKEELFKWPSSILLPDGSEIYLLGF